MSPHFSGMAKTLVLLLLITRVSVRIVFQPGLCYGHNQFPERIHCIDQYNEIDYRVQGLSCWWYWEPPPEESLCRVHHRQRGVDHKRHWRLAIRLRWIRNRFLIAFLIRFKCVWHPLLLLLRGFFFSILPFRRSTLFRLIFRVIRLPCLLKVGGPFLSSFLISCRHVFCILYHRWYRFFVSPSIDRSVVRMASRRFWALNIWLRTAEFGTNCGGSNCGELIN